MNKKIILVAMIMLSSCTLETPLTPSGLYNQGSGAIMDLAEKGRKYPYFNIRFTGFQVLDQDTGLPNATAEDNKKARIFTVNGKRYMLRRLDMMRFIINTPEFETNLLKAKVCSARNATGPAGTIRVGEQLDMKRVLLILQRARHEFLITKQKLSVDAAAVASVGASLYTSDLNTPIVQNNFIAFPNRDRLGEGQYSADGSYLISLLFHEVIHTMGFTHNAQVSSDLSYTGAAIISQTMDNPEWQKKYSKQLALFRPFYEEFHKEWLQEDTHPIMSRGFSLGQASFPTQKNIHYEHDTCILNADGTYTIIKGTKSI